MPHSGGGGSSSGGSSSDGGFSSFGGSHSGGSDSAPIRTSNTYFTGARTYVYYRDDTPQFVYADGDLKGEQSTHKIRYSLLIIYAIFYIGIISMMMSAVSIPKPLQGTESNKIYIEDNIDVLEESSELIDSMRLLKEKTGITPAIITVDDDSWKPYYDSLENYAYELYLNKLPDETYLLIVYSEPEHDSEDFNDWSYELMYGDDTDGILTGSVSNIFNNQVYEALVSTSKYNTTQAFASVFTDLSSYAMEKSIFFSNILMGLIGLAFITMHMYFMVFRRGKKRDYKVEELKEVKVNKEKPEIAKCDYCDGLYVVGTDLACPHCGAAVRTYITS